MNRNIQIPVNGQLATTQAITASGKWCYEGGSAKMHTITVALLQGSNMIAFQPTGSDAPFIDKIVLRAAYNVATTDSMNSAVQLRLSDLSGRVLTVRSLPQGFNGRAQIGGALRRGMYILTINNSNTQVSRKIIVQ